MGNFQKSDKKGKKAIMQDSIRIELPQVKKRIDIRGGKDKKIILTSIIDLIRLFEEQNTRRESIAYSAKVLSAQVRERFLEKISNHADLYEFFQFFDRWVGWLETYPGKNLSIRECFRECWARSLGDDLTWFSPLSSTFRVLEDAIPEWKQQPNNYRVLVPFAGKGVGSYFLREYFRAETLSSDQESDRVLLNKVQINHTKKDSYEWIQHQDLDGKRIILFFAYPPRIRDFERSWADLNEQEKDKIEDDPDSYLYGRKTDIRILDYVNRLGNLDWVIFDGCPRYGGSLAFHAYLHRRFKLRREHTVRAARHDFQMAEQLQIFEHPATRKRCHSFPRQKRLPTILEFMQEQHSGNRSPQSI
jgi:hypothetical protein